MFAINATVACLMQIQCPKDQLCHRINSGSSTGAALISGLGDPSSQNSIFKINKKNTLLIELCSLERVKS